MQASWKRTCSNRTTLIFTDADGPENGGKFAEKEKYLQAKQNIFLKNKLYILLILIILFIFDI